MESIKVSGQPTLFYFAKFTISKPHKNTFRGHQVRLGSVVFGESTACEHGLVNDTAFGDGLIDKSQARTGMSPALAGRMYPKTTEPNRFAPRTILC